VSITTCLKRLAARTHPYLVGLLSIVAFATPAQAQLARVNIGYVTASDFLPAMIARERGFFERHGIDATLTRVALAPNVMGALISGDLQIGMSTGPILVQAVENGLGVVAIAGAAHFRRENPVVSLVARPGAKITSVADLRGKKVGVPGLRSMLHVLFQKWLLQNNILLNQVNMVEAAFPQMKDLLAGGTVDAVLAIEPVRSRILGDGTGVKVSDFVGEVNPDILAAFWASTTDWATKNPKVVQGFRDALREGIEFARSNPAEAKAIETKYLNIVSPVTPSWQVDLARSEFEFFGRISTELGLARQAVDPDKLFLK
jgi:NitT/TauT family transport system substrate-binding protein